jgi:DNA-binding transcriptional MerR regulator|tara:strand:+ start:200 stop:577 length:378 start_codon:yes stop_codon:yes gene_type:complete
MTPGAVGKFIETVGVPVAMAAACGFVVWWLLKWLTGSLGTQIKEIKQEIKDETDEVQGEIRLLHSITISLIDRIRVLERNTLLAHTTMLGQLGCKELPVWHETRKEKIAELKEQIKDIGRNGEVT